MDDNITTIEGREPTASEHRQIEATVKVLAMALDLMDNPMPINVAAVTVLFTSLLATVVMDNPTLVETARSAIKHLSTLATQTIENEDGMLDKIKTHMQKMHETDKPVIMPLARMGRA